jgi:hypothetical protein
MSFHSRNHFPVVPGCDETVSAGETNPPKEKKGEGGERNIISDANVESGLQSRFVDSSNVAKCWAGATVL